MATPTKNWNTAELKAKGKANLLNSLSNLKAVQEHGPLVMTHGEGIYLWDSDGKQYIDYIGSWGPMILGHAHPSVLEAVREHRPGVRALFMSGYTDDSVLRHGVVESADAFIQKPFTPRTLAKKVRDVLDGVAV